MTWRDFVSDASEDRETTLTDDGRYEHVCIAKLLLFKLQSTKRTHLWVVSPSPSKCCCSQGWNRLEESELSLLTHIGMVI